MSNPKCTLNEYGQTVYKIPTYDTKCISLEPPRFQSTVTIGNVVATGGTFTTKKAAESDAASIALTKIETIPARIICSSKTITLRDVAMINNKTIVFVDLENRSNLSKQEWKDLDGEVIVVKTTKSNIWYPPELPVLTVDSGYKDAADVLITMAVGVSMFNGNTYKIVSNDHFAYPIKDVLGQHKA